MCTGLRTCRVLGVLLMSFATVVAAQPPSDTGAGAPAGDVLFASPTRIDHIGRIIVPVMINGQGPFRFIVDTGANYSTISPGLAAKLGLEPTADASILVNGVTGTARVPAVAITRLQAGDLLVENQQLPVVWAPLMSGAEGILGVAGLTQETLFVDFQHNRVRIARSVHGPDPRWFARIPAKRVRGGLLSVMASVGGVRVQAIIDTGSERTIANNALRDALHRRSKRLLKSTSVYGATTEVAPGELDRSPLIDFGSVQIGSTTLTFGDFHIFDVWGLTRRPAMIVGMDVLGTVTSLTIDFHAAQIFIDSNYHRDSH